MPSDALFAPAAVECFERDDGTIILRSPQPLGAYPRCVGEYLEYWAAKAPDRAFLLERAPNGAWRGVTYAQALDEVVRLGAWLLDRDIAPDHPVAILSDNSVQHALLSLASMQVGIPTMPVSPAYSLMSRDHAKLKGIIELTRPAVIYVDDPQRYSAALEAIRPLHDAALVAGSDAPAHTLAFDELRGRGGAADVARAFAAVTPDTVAKLLFTSGSTGEPKGVINTQRMLCASQQAKAQIWPLLERTAPIVVDWLPWNHTFGGNHNLNLILRNGGTLYIDGGRPAPPLFGETLRNLREIAPTMYFNVPRGFDMLVTALRSDEKLRKTFFSRLQLIFYAAAALPQNLWDALIELSVETTGTAVPLVSAWGSTETSPLATDCYFQAQRSGVVGLPVPGCELKLVPNGDKHEVRVRGVNVTPGYWQRPELTEKAFDAEGFYCIGDAMRFADRASPSSGLVFDGRVAEDFKLSSGTWVNVGMLRIRAIAALAPVAQDIVIAGHDLEEIGFLIFPNIAGCRSLCSDLPADAPLAAVLSHAAVRNRIAAGLAELRRENSGSSMHASRAALLHEPPSIDDGEITDKGYINQRAVLLRRRDSVRHLYDNTHPATLRPQK